MKNEQTQDSATPIDTRIREKRQRLVETAASLSVYMAMQHKPSVVAKVQELQDRLEFRTKQYEEQLLDEKVAIYKECLSLIKP